MTSKMFLITLKLHLLIDLNQNGFEGLDVPHAASSMASLNTLPITDITGVKEEMVNGDLFCNL